MRKGIRGTIVLLLAYLVQATVLNHFKISGVMIDLIAVTLFAIGYYLGVFASAAGGLLMALIMETLTGELSGFISVFCIAASALGAYVEPKFRHFERPGKRRQDRLIKWLAPIVSVGLFVIAREAIYTVYFYLTGVEIRLAHIMRMLLSGILASGLALPLFPVIGGFVHRPIEDSFLGKRLLKRKKPDKSALPELVLPLPDLEPEPTPAVAKPPEPAAEPVTGGDEENEEK